MDKRGMVVSVRFDAEGISGDWNCELRDPRTDKPFGVLPERAVDDATFAMNELRDFRPMTDLRELAAVRGQMIERHFLATAQKLIAEIERREGWPHAQDDNKEPGHDKD